MELTKEQIESIKDTARWSAKGFISDRYTDTTKAYQDIEEAANEKYQAFVENQERLDKENAWSGRLGAEAARAGEKEYKEAFTRSAKIHDTKFLKAKKVVDSYQHVFDAAQKVIDDIDNQETETNWFPCGRAFVYIDHKHELGKALRQLNGNQDTHWSTLIFDCKLPIAYNCNQSLADYERKAQAVRNYITEKFELPVEVYSWVD